MHNPYRGDYDKELGVALMIGDWWHKLSQELAVNLFFGPEQAETCEATQAHCIPRGNRADYSSARRRSAANEFGPPEALRWAVHKAR